MQEGHAGWTQLMDSVHQLQHRILHGDQKMQDKTQIWSDKWVKYVVRNMQSWVALLIIGIGEAPLVCDGL